MEKHGRDMRRPRPPLPALPAPPASVDLDELPPRIRVIIRRLIRHQDRLCEDGCKNLVIHLAGSRLDFEIGPNPTLKP